MRALLSRLFRSPSRPNNQDRPSRPSLRPALEVLEDRVTPAGFFFTGVGSATSPAEPFARIYDATTPGNSSNVVGPGNINAFPGFSGSVRVASGDVNGDGVDDIICAQGPGTGSGSQVRIFDGRSALFNNSAVLIATFFVYSNGPGVTQTPGFNGGVFVAAADLNGDGFDELITSPGLGARGHVKVFNFNNGGTFLSSNPELRASFFAYTDFAGEVRVTTLTRTIGGQKVPFVVTASGAGTSQSDVRLYGNAYNIGQVADLTFVPPALQFFPFAGYTGGVSVAAGDTDGDGNDELFVSKNDGVSTVRVFNIASVIAQGTSMPTPQTSFTAFDGFQGEVRLGAADVDGDGQVEVLTSTGSSPGAAGSHIKAWAIDAGGAVTVRSFFAYQGYVGGVWLSTNDFNWEQEFPSTDTPVGPIDNGTGTSSLTVTPRTLDDSALTPRSIEVDLNISAGENADVDLNLIAPNGTVVTLFTDVNAGGTGFNVTLTDDPTVPRIDTAAAGAPLTGRFRIEIGSLIAALGNVPIAGTWKLAVTDDTAGFTTTLNSWTLRFGL